MFFDVVMQCFVMLCAVGPGTVPTSLSKPIESIEISVFIQLLVGELTFRSGDIHNTGINCPRWVLTVPNTLLISTNHIRGVQFNWPKTAGLQLGKIYLWLAMQLTP